MAKTKRNRPTGDSASSEEVDAALDLVQRLRGLHLIHGCNVNVTISVSNEGLAIVNSTVNEDTDVPFELLKFGRVIRDTRKVSDERPHYIG